LGHRRVENKGPHRTLYALFTLSFVLVPHKMVPQMACSLQIAEIVARMAELRQIVEFNREKCRNILQRQFRAVASLN
jgi:hypothetical protein